MSTACVLVAAGEGSRLGAGGPKAFVEVGGLAVVVRAASAVLAAGCVEHLVVVVPADRVPDAAALLPPSCLVVAGAPDRRGSVSAGLRALEQVDSADGVDVVLVHDAARCLTPPSQVARVEAAVRAGHPVVVPAVPVHDTVRRVDPSGPGSALVDRDALRAVQTPQGFVREVLRRAHAADGGALATDDATLAERLGHPVHLVEGSAEAFKVTGPLDLALAEALVAREAR